MVQLTKGHKHLEMCYKVDIHHLIKSAGVSIGHSGIVLSKWEEFEVLAELSAQAQSRQVISRISYAKWVLS